MTRRLLEKRGRQTRRRPWAAPNHKSGYQWSGWCWYCWRWRHSSETANVVDSRSKQFEGPAHTRPGQRSDGPAAAALTGKDKRVQVEMWNDAGNVDQAEAVWTVRRCAAGLRQVVLDVRRHSLHSTQQINIDLLTIFK